MCNVVVLLSVKEFELVDAMDFNEINVFLHSMLAEESTLKNHFIVHPKLDRCIPCDVKLEVKNKSQATLQDD